MTEPQPVLPGSSHPKHYANVRIAPHSGSERGPAGRARGGRAPGGQHGHSAPQPRQRSPVHSRLPDREECQRRPRVPEPRSGPAPPWPRGQRDAASRPAYDTPEARSAPPRGLCESRSLKAETGANTNQSAGRVRMTRPSSGRSQSKARGPATRRHSNQLASSLRPALFHREKKAGSGNRPERVPEQGPPPHSPPPNDSAAQ